MCPKVRILLNFDYIFNCFYFILMYKELFIFNTDIFSVNLIKVLNKVGDEIKSFENMDETTVNEGYKKTMFPPTDEENKNINLQRW